MQARQEEGSISVRWLWSRASKSKIILYEVPGRHQARLGPCCFGPPAFLAPGPDRKVMPGSKSGPVLIADSQRKREDYDSWLGVRSKANEKVFELI